MPGHVGAKDDPGWPWCGERGQSWEGDPHPPRQTCGRRPGERTPPTEAELEAPCGSPSSFWPESLEPSVNHGAFRGFSLPGKHQ